MTRPSPPSPTPSCRIPATTPHRPISVHPGMYQPAIEILQNEHPCGLQPEFGEPVQNIN